MRDRSRNQVHADRNGAFRSDRSKWGLGKRYVRPSLGGNERPWTISMDTVHCRDLRAEPRNVPLLHSELVDGEFGRNAQLQRLARIAYIERKPSHTVRNAALGKPREILPGNQAIWCSLGDINPWAKNSKDPGSQAIGGRWYGPGRVLARQISTRPTPWIDCLVHLREKGLPTCTRVTPSNHEHRSLLKTCDRQREAKRWRKSPGSCCPDMLWNCWSPGTP